MTLPRDAPVSPTVFLSYGEDVTEFVEKFAKIFARGNALRIGDWLRSPVPAGEHLLPALEKQVLSCDVFVAFVNESYKDKISAQELENALRKRSDGTNRPLLIPIIVGHSGLNWWQAVGDFVKDRHSRFDPSVADLVYQGFFWDGTDDWRFDDRETRNVIKLRKWVLKKLSTSSVDQTTSSAHQMPSVEMPADVSRPGLWVLGCPFAAASADLAADIEAFRVSAADRGLEYRSIPDGWLQTTVALDDLTSGSVLLQPTSVADAPRHVHNPGSTRNLLSGVSKTSRRAELDSSKVVIWLPGKHSLEQFEQREEFLRRAAEAPSDPRRLSSDPVFRIDSPSDLMRWLARIPGLSNSGPVVAFQRIEKADQEDMTGAGAAESDSPMDTLPTRLYETVKPVLPPDPYEHIFAPFEQANFKEIFEDLADQRPILIAHDLSLSASDWMIDAPQRSRRQQVRAISARLTSLQTEADKILSGKNRGVRDVFWLACIRDATALPDTDCFPGPPALHRWQMLRVDTHFIPLEKARQGVVKALRDWAGA